MALSAAARLDGHDHAEIGDGVNGTFVGCLLPDQNAVEKGDTNGGEGNAEQAKGTAYGGGANRPEQSKSQPEDGKDHQKYGGTVAHGGKRLAAPKQLLAVQKEGANLTGKLTCSKRIGIQNDHLLSSGNSIIDFTPSLYHETTESQEKRIEKTVDDTPAAIRRSAIEGAIVCAIAYLVIWGLLSQTNYYGERQSVDREPKGN